MPKYKLSKKAEEDIKSIYIYIKKDNKSAAREVIIKLRQTFELLEDLPQVGKTVIGLDVPGIRIVPARKFSNYLIVYLNTKDQLIIIRIINAKQHLPTILNTEFGQLL